jgi:hypothetical protein
LGVGSRHVDPTTVSLLYETDALKKIVEELECSPVAGDCRTRFTFRRGRTPNGLNLLSGSVPQGERNILQRFDGGVRIDNVRKLQKRHLPWRIAASPAKHGQETGHTKQHRSRKKTERVVRVAKGSDRFKDRSVEVHVWISLERT